MPRAEPLKSHLVAGGVVYDDMKALEGAVAAPGAARDLVAIMAVCHTVVPEDDGQDLMDRDLSHDLDRDLDRDLGRDLASSADLWRACQVAERFV